MHLATLHRNHSFSLIKFVITISVSLNLIVLGFGLTGIDAGRATMNNGGGACTLTAKAAFKACRKDAADDYWIAVGNCANVPDPDLQAECLEEAEFELDESRTLCQEQREARLEICDELGEAPYDPVIDPGNFVDFEKVFEGLEAFEPNPYLPLVPGTVRTYHAKTIEDDEEILLEEIVVEVLEETKEIQGVNCIVVRDRVWEFDDENEKVLIEDTYDWFGQDLSGNVWYMGELAKNFEDGELENLDGSWKAGKDFAKAGILVFAAPVVGEWYRQEFSLGEAEDMAEVIEVGTEELVEEVNEYLSQDLPVGSIVLKTREFSPIEPGFFEYKYYVQGVGNVLETNPEDNEWVELISIGTP